MKNRYRLKRGCRSACEYDVLIYLDSKLKFKGSFVTRGPRRSSDDMKIMAALKKGLETLNL